MPVTIETLSQQLSAGGVRHHMDVEEQAIRVVFVTRRYVSPRSEKLAIIRVTAAEKGTLCRVALERAFMGGPRMADTCLAVCEALAGVPLVRVEHDATCDWLRLAAELPVEDGELTLRQAFALLDAVVAGAEAGQAALAAARREAA
jgi:hypothetical protein